MSIHAKLRRQGSNLRFAINSRASYRLDHARTESGGSRTRTCERHGAACALATRCLARLGHASRGRRGSRTLKARGPTRVRDGIPRLMAVLPIMRVAPAGVEPATARVRTGSSAVVELRSREVWPAGVEPAAPRVSGGRSTGLSYGHMRRWARLESNQRPLVCETSALAWLSYSPMGLVVGRAGLEPAASSVSEKRSSS